MLSFVEQVTWEEIRNVWEEHLWPNKKNGVAKANEWTWECHKNKLGKDKDMAKNVEPTFFGIWSNNKLVAVNSCYISNKNSFWRYWRSRGLWVDPEFRNQGYATIILTRSKEYAKENYGSWMWTVPRQSAFKAYHKAGFLQKSDWFDDGQYGPNYIAATYL